MIGLHLSGFGHKNGSDMSLHLNLKGLLKKNDVVTSTLITYLFAFRTRMQNISKMVRQKCSIWSCHDEPHGQDDKQPNK